jgi:hypothetical protein
MPIQGSTTASRTPADKFPSECLRNVLAPTVHIARAIIGTRGGKLRDARNLEVYHSIIAVVVICAKLKKVVEEDLGKSVLGSRQNFEHIRP